MLLMDKHLRYFYSYIDTHKFLMGELDNTHWVFSSVLFPIGFARNMVVYSMLDRLHKQQEDKIKQLCKEKNL